MAAITPEAPQGAFKSLWGRLFGFVSGDQHSHLFASSGSGANAKVVASTRNDMFTIFTGNNGAGGCTLTGARVGDIVLGITLETGTAADSSASFETVISVADQLQQTSASDLSGNKYSVLVKRQS